MKNENGNGNIGPSQKKKKEKKSSQISLTDGKFRQPTIMDALRKAGAIPSQEPSMGPSGMCSKGSASEPSRNQQCNINMSANVDVSTAVDHVEAQRHKFRPLLLDCFTILTFQKVVLVFLMSFFLSLTPHLLPIQKINKFLPFAVPVPKVYGSFRYCHSLKSFFSQWITLV